MNATQHHIFNSVGNPPDLGGPTVQWHYADTQRSYGVQLNWQSPGIEKSIYYDIVMHCTKMNEGNAVWEVSKNNYYTDNKRPENTIELLAIACAETFYPFKFTTSIDGRMVNLLNIEQIKKRFELHKPILKRDFIGGIADKYIAVTESALNDPKQLKNIVSADVWLSMFFAAITGNYHTNKTKAISFSLPLFGFEDPLVFKGSVSIGNPDLMNEAQALEVNATLDSFPVINNEPLLNGRMEATYDIDIPGHHIRNISSHITVTTFSGEHHFWLKGYKIEAEQHAPQQEELKPKSKSWFSLF